MKHKPMLLQKILSGNRGSGKSSIGLIGCHHGAGVTYTGLMLAFYIAGELGRKTAFIECNKHQDMRLIEEAYEWTSSDSDSFSFQNISCYKELALDRIPQIYGEDYEALIFDFGIDLNNNINEFLRCNTKIIVAGRSEWELIKLKKFVEHTRYISGSTNWIYLLRQADTRTIRKLNYETGLTFLSIPAVADPVMPTRSISRFFSMLLKQ